MLPARRVPVLAVRPGARQPIPTITATALTITIPTPPPALDIVMNFDMGASATPAFDPMGTNLTNIMTAVETYWEDIIEDPHTLNIDFSWADLNDAQAAARRQWNSTLGMPLAIAGGVSAIVGLGMTIGGLAWAFSE